VPGSAYHSWDHSHKGIEAELPRLWGQDLVFPRLGFHRIVDVYLQALVRGMTLEAGEPKLTV